MRAFFLLIPAVAFLFASTSALCSGEQYARFVPWMDDLARQLSAQSDPAQEAEVLLASNARTDAFYIQGLGKLYKDLDPKFKELRKDFKALEDGIGAMDKWNVLLNKATAANENPSVIALLKANREAAKQELAAYLVRKEWIGVPAEKTRLSKTRRFLENYAWPSTEEDRRYVLGILLEHINELDQASFDFSYLETGNGLHEYRRAMRWLLMEIRALNGLVIFNPDAQSCPVPVLKPLLTKPGVFDSPFAVLPSSEIEKKPCMISRCLFLAMNESVAELGALKDGAEAYSNIHNNGSDRTLPETQAAAQKIYSANQDAGLMSVLGAEIAACIR